MNDINGHDSEDSGLAYTIGFFSPEDADGVVALYREVYGDHYPAKVVYDPAGLIRQEETGEAHRLVARSPSGEVVGHIALFRSSPPNPQLYEDGCLMIRHDYRQTDLSFVIFSAVMTRLMPRFGIRYIWGEAVCNHLFTQQATRREGFIETGLEMDLMPLASYTVPGAQRAGGRVSAVLVFYLSDVEPRTVYTPACYDEFIRFLYAPIGQAVTFIRSEAPLPPGKTSGHAELFAGAGVARITLDTIGEDSWLWITRETLKAAEKGASVIQVFLRITEPSIGEVVSILHENGFFISGVLPCWYGDDGFLMQKIIGTPFFEGTHVYSKQAKQIKEYVEKDWVKRGYHAKQNVVNDTEQS
jgi:hypothetical protein